MWQIVGILSGKSFKWNHSFQESLRTTKTIIKFCEEHDRPTMPALRSFLAALEADDRDAALKAFKSIPFGGNGSFADWIPPIKFENENAEYVQVVFEAINMKWYLAATRLLDIKKTN